MRGERVVAAVGVNTRRGVCRGACRWRRPWHAGVCCQPAAFAIRGHPPNHSPRAGPADRAALFIGIRQNTRPIGSLHVACCSTSRVTQTQATDVLSRPPVALARGRRIHNHEAHMAPVPPGAGTGGMRRLTVRGGAAVLGRGARETRLHIRAALPQVSELRLPRVRLVRRMRAGARCTPLRSRCCCCCCCRCCCCCSAVLPTRLEHKAGPATASLTRPAPTPRPPRQLRLGRARRRAAGARDLGAALGGVQRAPRAGGAGGRSGCARGQAAGLLLVQRGHQGAAGRRAAQPAARGAPAAARAVASGRTRGRGEGVPGARGAGCCRRARDRRRRDAAAAAGCRHGLSARLACFQCALVLALLSPNGPPPHHTHPHILTHSLTRSQFTAPLPHPRPTTAVCVLSAAAAARSRRPQGRRVCGGAALRRGRGL